RIRAGIFVEQLYAIDVRQPADGVATDPDTSRLAVAARGELPDRFVSKSPRARDHPDLARLMDVPGHDADLTGAWSNDPRAIRSDQSRLLCTHQRLYPHHVHHRNSLRDANHQFYPCIHGFKD